MALYPTLSASHVACTDLPHYALLHTSLQVLCGLMARSNFRQRLPIGDPVLMEEPQRHVQPFATPPLPGEENRVNPILMLCGGRCVINASVCSRAAESGISYAKSLTVQ